MVLTRVANLLLAMSQMVGSISSAERRIIFGSNGFRWDYASPNAKENRSWDREQYSEGAVFIKGYANSIKVQPSDDEERAKLIPSEKYKLHMKNHVFEQALYAEKMNLDRIFYAILGTAGLSALTLIAITVVATA